MKPQYKSEEYAPAVIQKFSHIKRRRDLVELTNLQRIADGRIGACLSGGGADLVLAKGKKFAYIDECGHVNSLASLETSTECSICGHKYTQSNVVVINPTTAEDRTKLLQREHDLARNSISHSREPTKRKHTSSPDPDRKPRKLHKKAV